MTTRKSSTTLEIKNSFDDFFNSYSKEELLEQEARLLSFHFLSGVEQALEQQRISKKLLAEKVGTSASYITQLFRGDRLPNFYILAKMQDALGLKFEIKVQDVAVGNEKTEFEFPEIQDQHGFWVFKNIKPDYEKPSVADFKGDYNEAKVA